MNYLSRYIFWNYSDINDYKKFSFQEILNDSTYFSFKIDTHKESYASDRLKYIEYRYKNKILKCPLDDLLESTGTTAFIIIKNDSVFFERYYNNSSRESINTSFSIAKSFTSTLIGIAIDEGYINSINDPIIQYIPEIKDKVSDTLSIKHLLLMSSGIRYNPKYYPWADEPKSYYYPDLKNLVLKKAEQEYQPDTYFKYVNYNTILLGIILERATKISPCKYLQDKIWKPIGMEYSASWSIDSRKNNFQKMESGINARSIDYAKIGRLFLQNGNWNNKRILSESWIIESTSPPYINEESYYISKNYNPYAMFFKDKQLYYKYGWWGIKRGEKYYDYMALGIYGQFIYVCPEKQMIIVRNGRKWGKIDWWPSLFKEISKLI
jgi:CubicO group peptidase (beta-lactamase class C family)